MSSHLLQNNTQDRNSNQPHINLESYLMNKDLADEFESIGDK